MWVQRLIDGEAVVLLRNDGWSDFVALMTKRADRKPRSGAFDHQRLGLLEARQGRFQRRAGR
jgi:hypothetical protein